MQVSPGDPPNGPEEHAIPPYSEQQPVVYVIKQQPRAMRMQREYPPRDASLSLIIVAIGAPFSS